MNKSSDMIFRLVKSLKPKETADFRRTLTIYDVAKGKNNFLTLFDALNGFTDYDEKLLRKKLPKTFKQSNLSSLKTQLKSKLMDFLILHHRSDFQRIHRRLEEIEVLFTRGFYPEASAAVTETKQLIQETNIKSHLFIANYFESCLLNYLGEKNVLVKLKDIANLNAQVASELNVTYRLGSYIARVMVVQAKGIAWRNKEDKIELNELTQCLTHDLTLPDLTFQQKMIIHATLLRLTALGVHLDEAFKHASILHRMIFEAYESFKHSDSEKFFAHLADIVGCAIHAKKVEQGLIWLADMERSLKDLPASPMFAEFYEVLRYQLKSLSENPVEQDNAFKQLLAFYTKTGFKHNAVQKEAELAIALAYFKRKEYRDADYYLYQMVESAQSTDFFMEHYEFIRVLRLVMLYEQLFLQQPQKLSFDSYRLQVNTVYQRIRKKPEHEDYRLERIMLDFFRSNDEQTTKTERKQLLIEAEKKLQGLFKESPLYVKQISEYFNFLEWVETKLK